MTIYYSNYTTTGTANTYHTPTYVRYIVDDQPEISNLDAQNMMSQALLDVMLHGNQATRRIAHAELSRRMGLLETISND